MYPAYAKWIQSHRDLPLKLNQWCNIVVRECNLLFMYIYYVYNYYLLIALFMDHRAIPDCFPIGSMYMYKCMHVYCHIHVHQCVCTFSYGFISFHGS